MQRRLFTQLGACLPLAAMARPAAAQVGERPISWVVGYSAGGSADYIARAVGPELSRRVGRQLIIENAAGASGMLAVQKVLAAPADGSTLYMAGTDTVVVPMTNAKVRHDWDRDFVPVGRLTTVPMVFAVPAGSKYNNLADLIKRLKAGGGESLSYATPGVGTMQHLYGALINKLAGVTMLHIPYRGGAQIVNDLVGNQVDAAILVLSTAMPFIKDGRIKVLSVSDAARVPALPNVRSMAEEPGFQGVSLPLWQAMFAKAGTPAPLVAAYEKAILESLALPELKAKLQEVGITAAPMKGRELHAFIASQAGVYRDIIASAKISTE